MLERLEQGAKLRPAFDMRIGTTDQLVRALKDEGRSDRGEEVEGGKSAGQDGKTSNERMVLERAADPAAGGGGTGRGGTPVGTTSENDDSSTVMEQFSVVGGGAGEEEGLAWHVAGTSTGSSYARRGYSMAQERAIVHRGRGDGGGVHVAVVSHDMTNGGAEDAGGSNDVDEEQHDTTVTTQANLVRREESPKKIRSPEVASAQRRRIEDVEARRSSAGAGNVNEQIASPDSAPSDDQSARTSSNKNPSRPTRRAASRHTSGERDLALPVEIAPDFFTGSFYCDDEQTVLREAQERKGKLDALASLSHALSIPFFGILCDRRGRKYTLLLAVVGLVFYFCTLLCIALLSEPMVSNQTGSITFHDRFNTLLFGPPPTHRSTSTHNGVVGSLRQQSDDSDLTSVPLPRSSSSAVNYDPGTTSNDGGNSFASVSGTPNSADSVSAGGYRGTTSSVLQLSQEEIEGFREELEYGRSHGGKTFADDFVGPVRRHHKEETFADIVKRDLAPPKPASLLELEVDAHRGGEQQQQEQSPMEGGPLSQPEMTEGSGSGGADDGAEGLVGSTKWIFSRTVHLGGREEGLEEGRATGGGVLVGAEKEQASSFSELQVGAQDLGAVMLSQSKSAGGRVVPGMIGSSAGRSKSSDLGHLLAHGSAGKELLDRIQKIQEKRKKHKKHATGARSGLFFPSFSGGGSQWAGGADSVAPKQAAKGVTTEKSSEDNGIEEWSDGSSSRTNSGAGLKTTTEDHSDALSPSSTAPSTGSPVSTSDSGSSAKLPGKTGPAPPAPWSSPSSTKNADDDLSAEQHNPPHDPPRQRDAADEDPRPTISLPPSFPSPHRKRRFSTLRNVLQMLAEDVEMALLVFATVIRGFFKTLCGRDNQHVLLGTRNS